MDFRFLEIETEVPVYDANIQFPPVDFDHIIPYSPQFYQKSNLVLRGIKRFSLSPMLQTIISKQKEKKDCSQPLLFTLDELISFYLTKQTNFNDNQKLNIVAFIISFVNMLDIYEDFFQYIDIIFDTTFFPADPINSHVFNYTQNLDLFLFNCIYSINDALCDELYLKIAQIWENSTENWILNLMPLINQLLYQWKTNNFFSIFVHSSLFSIFLKRALNNKFLFTFVHNCFQINPTVMFQHDTYIWISVYFLNSTYRGLAASLLYSMIKLSNTNQIIQSNFLLIINTIVSNLLTNEDEEPILISLDIITNTFPFLQIKAIQTIFQSTLLENLAQIAILKPDYFKKYLFFLTEMRTNHYEFIEWFSYSKQIQNTLKQWNFKDLPYYEILEFAFCSNSCKEYSEQYIRNWTAIDLLLSLLPKAPEKEEEISNILSKLSENDGNLIELKRAKMPEFILSRLLVIQNNQALRNLYFQLFSKITFAIFDSITFYHTIGLLKCPDFEYPTEILDILNKHLELYSKINSFYHPASFFRFDDSKDCGIFGPSLKLSSTFSILFWIRLNDINSNKANPLLNLDFGKNQISFCFEKGKMFVSDTRKNNKKYTFDFQFEQGIWYDMIISSEKNLISQKITLYINNIKKSSIDIPNLFFLNVLNADCNISICSKQNMKSLMCDLSTLMIFDQMDIEYLMNSRSNISQLAVCIYDPSNAHDGQIFQVNKNNPNVSYKGRTIPYISNIKDVVQNVGAITNFLPLFDRLSYDFNGKKFEIEKGYEYLRILLAIFSKMVNICEPMFISCRFFELLASFLNVCEGKFLTVPVINQLSLLFYSLKSDELKSQMIYYIFLNYEIAKKLDVSAFGTLYDAILPILINQENSFEFNIDSLIFKTMNYFSETSPTSDFSWKFLKRVILNHKSGSNAIDCLLRNLVTFKPTYINEQILKILEEMISPYTIQYFEKYSYTTPFIISISECKTNNQILSFECILKLAKYASFSIDTTFRYANFVLQKNDDEFDHFTEKVLSSFINKNKIIENSSLFPLIVKANSLSSKSMQSKVVDSVFESITQFSETAINLIDIASWEALLMDLISTVYDSDTDVEMFSLPFSTLFEIELQSKRVSELSLFMHYLDCLSLKNGRKYRDLKRQILMQLIFAGQLSSEQVLLIFPILFDFIIMEFAFQYLQNTLKISFKINQFSIMKDEIDRKLAMSLIDLAFQADGDILVAGVYKVNILVAACFFALNILKKDTEQYNTYLSELRENLPAYSIEVHDEITQMLSSKNNEELIKNSWFSKLFEKSDEIISKKEEIINNLYKRLNEGQIEFLGLDENSPISKRLISVVDPDSFSTLYADSESFMLKQESDFEIEKKILIRIRDSFLRDISKIPGPWSINDFNRYYKALNRYSKRGQRILMKINNDFNDHRDASKNRDCSTKTEIAHETFVYKPLRKMPILSEGRSFYTRVEIRSPSKQINGMLIATKNMIQFLSEVKNILVYWNDVEFILNRRVANIDDACEIFTKCGKSYFIIFSEGERKRFYMHIGGFNFVYNDISIQTKFDFFQSLRIVCHGIVQNKPSSELVQKLKLTSRWKNREITTFSYLYYLNLLSGRSYNDLKQYPIYPYIIKECESNFLDLNDPNSYRDLSVPIPFICPRRRNIPNGMNLFNQLPSSEFLTTWGMVRVEPFTSLQILFQGKKFLESPRQFFSIYGLWNNMTTNIQVNESLPDNFCFPFMYINENHFDLGIRVSDGIKVDDVILPKWSDNAFVYTSTNRIALESPITSSAIHKWIDFFFGINRRMYDGKKLYPDFSYPELMDKKLGKKTQNYCDDCETELDVEFTEEQRIQNCEELGTMPEQLFFEPHEQRDENFKVPTPPVLGGINIVDPVSKIIKNVIVLAGSSRAFDFRPSTNELIELSVPVGYGELLCVSKNQNLLLFGTKQNMLLTSYNLATKEIKSEFRIPSIITTAAVVGGRLLVIGGSDCSIRVWNLFTRKQISNSGFHTSYITSIGACYDNGLLVSLDENSILVFETLIDHKFIASVSLNSIIEGLKKMKQKQQSQDLIQRIDENAHTTNENQSNIGTIPENSKIESNSKLKCENEITSDELNEINSNIKQNNENPKKSSNNALTGNILINDDIEAILNNYKHLENIFRNENDFKFEQDDLFVPQICVFRSGIVCVSQKTMLIFFDSHGKVITIRKLKRKFYDMKKYYDFDTREFLIVGTEPKYIEIIDMTTFLPFARIEAYNYRFYPIKNTRSILISSHNELHVYSFANFIPPVIMNYQNNEMPPIPILRKHQAQ